MKISFVLPAFFLLLLSCSDDSADQKKIDSMLPPAKNNAASSIDSDKNEPKGKPEAPFKLSKEDSTRVADSVARYRNPVRDFE